MTAPSNDPGPAGVRSMSRYLLLVAAVLVTLLAALLIARALPVPFVEDPRPWLAAGGVYAALVGAALLVVDVVLPVPSSLVMVAHGALFGVVLGATVSVVGTVGATLAGYGLGRWAVPPLLRRVFSVGERERATALVGRWGLLAVVASRPVPLHAETMALVAGAERLGVLRTVAGSAVRALPAALLYAHAGARGGADPGGFAVFGGVLAITALLWLIGRAALLTHRST